MKIIIDEALPQRTAGWLRDHGIDAQHVIELDMRGASDETIIAHAVQQNAAIATLDSDFHTHLARTQATEPSVIRLRVESINYILAGQLLLKVLQDAADDLAQGVAISVNNKRMRVRRLPLEG
ncbi:DUF5615 family PIN-like protein [Planctomycetales bacterium ZRK34]|nr:DUF5615 family PIN-like protein [Planctomycetales bacterium ZRK34]